MRRDFPVGLVATIKVDMNPVLQALASTEVRWEGTDAGFMPELETNQSASLNALNKDETPDLNNALSDEEFFVVAHVLLTRISGIEYETFPTWNHLAVEIAADGTVTIDPQQRHRLATAWRQWYNSKPRSVRLPVSG